MPETLVWSRKAACSALLLALSAAARPLAGQDHTTDIPRLSIGFAGGRHSGTLLWTVPAQTISAGIDPATIKPGIDPNGKPYPTSDFALRREIDIGLTFNAHANLYVNSHVGFSGELTYLGLQFKDSCTLAHDGGVGFLRQACSQLGTAATGVDPSASAFLMQVGAVIRPFHPATLQPFLTGMIGMANTPHNSVATRTTYNDPDNGPIDIVIYPDVGWSPIRPVMTAGFGITTAPINKVQFVAEYRISWITQPIVTGSTATQNTVPPTSDKGQGYQSILVGIDIVLRSEHGTRY